MGGIKFCLKGHVEQPPVSPIDVVDLMTYMSELHSDDLRGTKMLQVHLHASQTGGFDARHHRKCGLCFRDLPFYLRAVVGRVFVALARYMKLGAENGDSGRGRGRAHALEWKALLCIPDDVLWMDPTKEGWGLIDGKFGLLEGLSITLSAASASGIDKLLGFLGHFDVANDSRWG
jgi:hypothetical protein